MAQQKKAWSLRCCPPGSACSLAFGADAGGGEWFFPDSFILSSKSSLSLTQFLLSCLGPALSSFPYLGLLPSSQCKGTRLEILPWERRLHQAFKNLSCIAPFHMLLLCITGSLFSFTPFFGILHSPVPWAGGRMLVLSWPSRHVSHRWLCPCSARQAVSRSSPLLLSPHIEAPQRSLSACWEQPLFRHSHMCTLPSSPLPIQQFGLKEPWLITLGWKLPLCRVLLLLGPFVWGL